MSATSRLDEISEAYQLGCASGYRKGIADSRQEPTKRKSPSPELFAMQAADVAWYRKHGAFPERIAKDRYGNEYVIGDFCWNARKFVQEVIDPLMPSTPTQEQAP